MTKLSTPRLILFPFNLIYIQMYLEGREYFQRTFPFRVPDSWPWKEMKETAPWIKSQLLRDFRLARWLTWLIVLLQEKALIGDAGFSGPPGPEGSVEISYNIVPEYQNRGYGAEAVAALIRWAFAHPQVRVIKADTWSTSCSSMHLLEKMGMERTQQTPDLVHWSLERAAFARRSARHRTPAAACGWYPNAGNA